MGINANGISQNYLADIQHFTIEEGLSHREVFDIHQDEEGFIWLATKYGLNRFDGQSFKVWTKEKQGLSSNEIHHIFEDEAGWLWLFTSNNWFHLHHPIHCSLVHAHSGEVLTLEEKFGEELPFALTDITDVMINEKKQLFFSTKDYQLFSYLPEKGFQLIPTNFDGLFFPGYYAESEFGQDTIWGYLGEKEVLHAYEFIAINEKGETLIREPFEGTVDFLRFYGNAPNKLSFGIFLHDKKPFLFSLDSDGKRKEKNYLHFIDGLNPDWEKSDWTRQFFYQASQDFFWLKTHPHFFAFHLEKGLIYDFEKDFPDLIAADIHTVFFDKDDFVWVGTASGLYKIELKNAPFSHFLYQNYDDYRIWDAYSCRGIWVDNEDLWINTYKGRRYTNQKEEQLEILPYIPNPIPNSKKKFLLWNPLAIYRDKFQNSMWFGEASLVKRNIATKEERPYFWKRTIDNSPQIWSIYQDENQKIWLGTESGIGYLDTIDNFLKMDVQLESQIQKGFIHAFVERKDKSVWICSTTGLYLWSPEKGILNRFWTGGEGRNYLPHDNILHLYEEKGEILWLASGGGGLIKRERISTQKAENQQFTIADGLSNNNLYAIYPDDFGNFWMSSDYGIIRFNKNTLRAKAYLPSDGISHHEFNRISHFQDESGQIYFGGLNGVTAFDPANFQGNDFLNTPVKITDFQQMDGESEKLINKTSEILTNRQITLNPNDRFFRLQFAMLDYRNPELIRYAWKVEGLDESWNHIDENFIRVIGLPYGEHLLKIKGQAANGEWSENELHVPVTVLRPFYFKTWFIIAAGIAFFGAFLGWYKWRTLQLKEQEKLLKKLVNERTEIINTQKEELEQLDKLKSRFFANVSHELRTPLTLILGPVAAALERNRLENRDFTFLKLAQQNGKQLLQLVNSLLDFSKIEVGKLQLQENPIQFYKLMKRLLAQYESNTQFHEIELNFEFEPETYLHIQLDVTKFETILNNLISNAIKFTPKGGKIWIRVKDLGNKLAVSVTDTGRGIHPDDLPHIFDRFYQSKKRTAKTEGGSGIGLALCQEYATLFNGVLTAESKLGEGSSFSLTFPKKEVLGITGSLVTPIEKEISPSNLLQPEKVFPQKTGDIPKFTILMVEDNPALRQYIQMILEGEYQILTAENGQAALAILDEIENSDKTNSRLPSLILSDVMMPIMDGFQFLEAVKAKENWKQIPFIMLTARADIQDKLKALRIGVDDYLLKPFEAIELKARIENLLRNYQERQTAKTTFQNIPEKEAEIIAPQKIAPDWLENLETLLEKELSNPNLSIDDLPTQLMMSRRNFFRQMKEHTGLTPNQYLREIRLQKARKLIEARELTAVKEVAYAVGFLKVPYFSNLFKQRFGKTPSEYL